jgi:hypothetical protein
MRVDRVDDNKVNLRHLKEDFFADKPHDTTAQLRAILEQNLDNAAMYDGDPVPDDAQGAVGRCDRAYRPTFALQHDLDAHDVVEIVDVTAVGAGASVDGVLAAVAVGEQPVVAASQAACRFPAPPWSVSWPAPPSR